ncbi:hypothetical protein EV685_1469 [Sphaerotilus mobilis]|uniref:Patatin-like phospholipase n=2 Tax=Sphaerotilus mobilis TaxID=47994 RepID=A0A4Q7LRE9_9BURK|nr:hypothetical protein EV685_1469 [Sphaerotilus mobilis]
MGQAPENTGRHGVKPGDFPFPMADGPHESRYLTWVRNNANYMAARGLMDYFRAVAVLLRGMIINALVVLPILLLTAIVVAWLHLQPEAPGFHITPWLLILSAVAVVLFPFLSYLLRIWGFRRSLLTGSDSSVKQRSRWERWYGAALVLIVVVAAFEALPAWLGHFHDAINASGVSWQVVTSLLGALLMFSSLSDKLLSLLGGLTQRIALLLVGALGLLIPTLIVMLVADFLVYTRVDWSWRGSPSTMASLLSDTALPVLMAWLLPAGITLLLIAGTLARAFSWKDFLKLVGALFVSVLIMAVAHEEMEHRFSELNASVDESLNELAKAMATLPIIAAGIGNDPEAQPEPADNGTGGMAWDRASWGWRWDELAGAMALLDPDFQKSADTLAPAANLPDALATLGKLGQQSSFYLAHELAADLATQLAALPVTPDQASAITHEIDLLNCRIAVLAPLSAWQDIEQRHDRAALLSYLLLAKDFPLLIGEPPESPSSACGQTWSQVKPLVKTEADAGASGGENTVSNESNSNSGSSNNTDSNNSNHSDTAIEPGTGEAGLALYPELHRVLGGNDPATRELLDGLLAIEIRLGYWYDLLSEIRWDAASSTIDDLSLYPQIQAEANTFRRTAFQPKALIVMSVALLLWLACWLTVDVNLTSIHGLYRDRLASAFLIGADTTGDVDIEEDLDLGDLARHEAGSTAPYHLINVALNLQGSDSVRVRDRRSDFFIFSKRFIGGRATGYCRSELMERVFPQMSLSTAMAISAAAASPNMGRATNPALVAFMTLMNVRLGIWAPNPGRLQDLCGPRRPAVDRDGEPAGFGFPEVFAEELREVRHRWQQLPGGSLRTLIADMPKPTVRHDLIGIGYSGGGIRSATLNLGITQALHSQGLFDHIDYMSTVSGGGYLGSSISALMRRRTRTESEIAGRVSLHREPDGGVRIDVESEPARGWQALRAGWRRLRGSAAPAQPAVQRRSYRYAHFAEPAVAEGERIPAGHRLLQMGAGTTRLRGTIGEQFSWRIRPGALLREMTSRLDEKHRWVNLSDGGHIENLAGIELLRRRCRFMLIGDGEADPKHLFNGLATLIRSARIDLGVHIDIDVDALRLHDNGLCAAHWAIGQITYPDEAEPGYLLYLKSSLTGDEDEVIREYRARSPSFPHESTADQMFSEGQFEAYRSLGQHIGLQVLKALAKAGGGWGDGPASHAQMTEAIVALHRQAGMPAGPPRV